MLRSLFVLAAALIACSTGPDDIQAPDPAADINLLFIGNSLTYTNDLPGLVTAFGQAAGVSIATRQHTAPNYAIEDHWNEGRAVQSVDRGGWDFVILQQGPSSLDESRANLIEYTTRFAVRIKAAGGTPALYAVWPDVSRLSVFDRVSESHRLAAVAAGGVLMPAGEAWRAAWRHDSALALYGPDGFHPSTLGTYAAALVIYRRATGRTTLGLPATVTTAGGTQFNLTPQVALLLQQSALEVDSLVAAVPRH